MVIPNRQTHPRLFWSGFATLLLLSAAALTLCLLPVRRHTFLPLPPTAQPLAQGVVLRHWDAAGSAVWLLDIDLKTPGLRLEVAAEDEAVQEGRVFADSHTVREWCRKKNALGGINGGFFGKTMQERKEVLGLLATEGIVRSSGRLTHSPGNPQRRFVHSVIGFGENAGTPGLPRIGWAVAERGHGALLTAYNQPLNPTAQDYWQVRSAVACGPRLISEGSVHVTDREERLVHPPAVPRTFVAYSRENGTPRHLVLGIGLSLTFRETADLLQNYFRETHQTACAEAMCLDGGSSSQLTYRTAAGWQDARATAITVPTAILLTRSTEHGVNAP
jgi:hypothetical protein